MMKFSLNFLKNYVAINISAEKLVELLTFHLTEAEIFKTKKDGDVIIDVDLQPNRADCYSYLGLAREIAALLGGKLRLPEAKVESSILDHRKKLLVKVLAKKSCPRYSARLILDLKVGKSPSWLRKKIKRSGISVNNNVIDILHYVMLEQGQPMHAFDADKIDGNIIVRKAKKPQKFLGLDGKNYQIEKGMLIICDEKKPIAIAGVIGSQETCVKKNTQNIILEAAKFRSGIIRPTAQRLGVTNESTIRFEKRLDPDLTLIALDRASYLIHRLAHCRAIGNVVDVRNSKTAPKMILLRYQKLISWLKYDLKIEEAKKILEALEFQIVQKDNELEVYPPSFRTDVSSDVDLIEEIARVKGLELIPISEMKLIKDKKINKRYYFKKLLSLLLTKFGLNEIFSPSFVGSKTIRKEGKKTANYLELANALSPDKQFLRSSLVDSVLPIISQNLKNRKHFKIFEFGKVFSYNSKTPIDQTELTIFIVNDNNKPQKPFLKAKYLIEQIWMTMGLPKMEFVKYQKPADYMHPKRAFKIKLSDQHIGSIYQLDPDILEKFDIKAQVIIIKLKFEQLVKLSPSVEKEVNINLSEKTHKTSLIKTISKYPAIIRDINIIVPKNYEKVNLTKQIIKLDSLILETKLIDKYESSQIGPELISETYRITIQSMVKTLTKEDAEKIINKIIKFLTKKYNAKTRN